MSGVGGERMEHAGLSESAVSLDDIAVMGTIELVGKLYKLHKCVNKVVDHLIEAKPDVIVAIDAKGFNKAVLKRYFKRVYGNADRAAVLSTNKLEPRPPPTIQYVAPSYWAYKSSSKTNRKSCWRISKRHTVYYRLKFKPLKRVMFRACLLGTLLLRK